MDIKKPNLSVLLEKLSFLRNNLALLAPICLALVAGLLFIPTELLSANLKKKIETESLGKANVLKRLQDTAKSTATIEVVQASQQAYVDDTNAVVDLSQQCGRRALLSYNLFPKPKDTSSLIFEQFGRNFIDGVDALVEHASATECPTDAELGEKGGRGRGRGRQSEREEMMMMEDLYSGYGGGGAGQGYQTAATSNMNEIEDAICLQKAQSSSLYVSFEDIAGYDFWLEYTFDGDTKFAVEDCWYWQLGYWIVEDAFATATACNEGSSTVLTSPVKRIRNISFKKRSAGMYGGGFGGAYGGGYGGGYEGGESRSTRGSGSSSEASLPKYVMATKDAMATPCTNRFSDETTDVVHFNLSVVLRNDYVLEFMKELCSAKAHRFYGYDGQEAEEVLQHNQITILESKIRTVVRRDGSHNLYRYGEDAVVELDLVCEYLLDRKGYEAIYPEVVKESFEDEQAGN